MVKEAIAPSTVANMKASVKLNAGQLAFHCGKEAPGRGSFNGERSLWGRDLPTVVKFAIQHGIAPLE